MALYKNVEGYRELFDEEYKKIRKLISEGETHLDNLAEGFIGASRVLDRILAADVVPKSEVERLEKELDSKQFCCDSCDRIMLTGAEHRACIKQAKAEVAREIFEEMDDITELFAKGLIEELVMYGKLAELKKKYTE